MSEAPSGPLAGVRIIEVVGLGPGPLCAMLLADMGAEVIRIDRIGGRPFGGSRSADLLGRNRRSIAIDLKSGEGVELALRLIEDADGLIEGYRPGVMERLGLGPDVCLARNPRLVYGRMTGWGQEGPLAQAAGHDINYIALAGALHTIGEADRNPVPPLNLVGDFGGGGLFLAFGLVCGILEARNSGQGQVVDVAMVDGTATLMGLFYAMMQAGTWRDEREANILDGGAHFYGTYRTSDGKWIAVGAIEPQFYAALIEHAGLDPAAFADKQDAAHWPTLKARLAEVFASRTRDEWCELLEGTDACFAPVLSLGEAPEHPHFKARETFQTLDGTLQPAPAPRFSRTPGELRHGPRPAGADSRVILRAAGLGEDEITALLAAGVVGEPA